MLPRNSQGLGYDRAISTFSPEGRLFQVEYALEAVRRGTLAVGVKCPSGAVIVVQKKLPSPLMDPETINKIYPLDQHMGCAISGLHADARILVDYARVQAQIHRLTYDEPMRLHSLIKKLADVAQFYTQHAAARPFGCALLAISVDADGPSLTTTDPSGTYRTWKATGMGENETAARDFMQKNYKDDMSLEAIEVLACKAILSTLEEGFDKTKLEIALVSVEEKKFRLATPEEFKKVISKV